MRRHEAAVANTLREADEAAACGDYVRALSWLSLIDAIGDGLAVEYEVKREAWRAAVVGSLAQRRA